MGGRHSKQPVITNDLHEPLHDETDQQHCLACLFPPKGNSPTISSRHSSFHGLGGGSRNNSSSTLGGGDDGFGTPIPDTRMSGKFSASRPLCRSFSIINREPPHHIITSLPCSSTSPLPLGATPPSLRSPHTPPDDLYHFDIISSLCLPSHGAPMLITQFLWSSPSHSPPLSFSPFQALLAN